MSIGAISGFGFQPYIYNTNIVSSASMNRLSRISDDVVDRKTDYSELVSDESKNINPLKKGQTLDFEGMLQKQLQSGRMNALRMMKSGQAAGTPDEESAQKAAAVVQLSAEAMDSAVTAEAAPAAETGSGMMEDAGYSSFQMQQAINAYTMSMIA